MLVLGAYAWNSVGRRKPVGMIYHGANAAGGVLLGLNAAMHRAWPAAALEAAWTLIALISIVRLRRNDNSFTYA